MKFFNCIPNITKGYSVNDKNNTLNEYKAQAFDSKDEKRYINTLEVVGLFVLDSKDWDYHTNNLMETNCLIAGSDRRKLSIYSEDDRIKNDYMRMTERETEIFRETCKVQVFKVVNAETGEFIYTRNGGYDYVREVFFPVDAPVSEWESIFQATYPELVAEQSEAEAVTDYEKHTEFVPGHTYSFGWACDANMTSYIEVVRRTDKTLWFKYQGEVVRRKIYNYNGIEQVRPTGTYSMNPVCSANKNVPQAQGQN